MSAHITATAYGSEKDEVASGAQNVVGYVDRQFIPGEPKLDGSGYGVDALAYTYRNEGESFDMTPTLTNEDFNNLFGYNVSRHIQQSLNPKTEFGTVGSGFKTTTYIQRKK